MFDICCKKFVDNGDHRGLWLNLMCIISNKMKNCQSQAEINFARMSNCIHKLTVGFSNAKDPGITLLSFIYMILQGPPMYVHVKGKVKSAYEPK